MAHPELELWLSTAEGQSMNPDGHYGLQCVDLVDQYAQDNFGVPWNVCVGGVSGAKQLLDRVPDEYWIRIDNNPNDPNLIPQRADVIVFGGSAINEWGHTCVCLEAYNNGMWVLQQDGFAPPLVWADGAWYSNKPAHRAWLPYDGNGTGMITGWLRPRENKLAITITPPPAPPAPPAPAPVASNLRDTVLDGVNRRRFADAKGEWIDTIPGDREVTLGGFVRSSSANSAPYNDGNNVWFVGGISGGYMHSSGFTNQSTDGLADLTGTEPTMPKVEVTPVLPPYDFKQDFDFVEKIPANITNVNVGDFPDKPAMIVIHQMGSPGIDTLGSTINEFKKASTFKSTHFAASKNRAVQMVSLKDRAYHAKEAGNVYVAIETDPFQDAETIATTRKLITAIRDHYGYKLELIRHNAIAGNNTTCGTLIDLDAYQTEWPTPAPVVTPPVVTPPVVQPPSFEGDVIRQFLEWLVQSFLTRKK